MTGVSTQTVSRVINGRPDVAPETRRRVEAAIRDRGFRPSEVARSLVHRRSRLLGVIVSGLRYHGVAEAMNGIAEASEAAGLSVILKVLAGFDAPDIATVVEELAAHRVGGIVVVLPEVGPNVRELEAHLPPSAPPFVFVKGRPADRHPSFGIDNAGAAALATRHLLALGRRRIAHLAGPLDWAEAADRRDGWLATLAEAGLEPGPCTAGDWSSASGAAAFRRILDADPGIDGLFAANDQMALGVLHVAHELGVAVPGRVALVGMDGLPEAAEFTPSLTTMRQPLREAGRLAVETLVADPGSPGEARAATTLLPVELILGDSAPAAR